MNLKDEKGVEPIESELDRIRKSQQLIIKSQTELIHSVLDIIEKDEIPETIMDGFSRCPNCHEDYLVYTSNRKIWCSNCGISASLNRPTRPYCPNCRKRTISFHPSGKAKCLSCTYEFYYRKKDKRDSGKPTISRFEDALRLLAYSQELVSIDSEPVSAAEEDTTSFMLSDDERSELLEEQQIASAEEKKVLIISKKEAEPKPSPKKTVKEELFLEEQEIEYLKPVEVEPFKFDWEETGEIEYECSECGCILTNSMDYCPACGADVEIGEIDKIDEVDKIDDVDKIDEVVKIDEVDKFDEIDPIVEVDEIDEDEEYECPDCGRSLKEKDNVCPSCGTSFYEHEDDWEDEDIEFEKDLKSWKREAILREKEMKIKSSSEIRKKSGKRSQPSELPPDDGVCGHCGNTKLQFFQDGVGLCPRCHHRFYWKKPPAEQDHLGIYKGKKGGHGYSPLREKRKILKKESIKKIEEKIGSIWLLITGIIIVTIGLIFAGIWSWSRIGEEGKIIGIFLFGIAVGIAGEFLYRRNRMIPFANGMSILGFISLYAGCGVMYRYDYNFPLIIGIASVIILANIAASYRYQMYLLIGMSILASYLLVTIMRITKIDGESFISAHNYAILLAGIAGLFTFASYLVFDRTRSSKMAYITVIVTNIWLMVFNGQMTSEILIAGALVMLLTAFLATGTSKMGLRRDQPGGKKADPSTEKKSPHKKYLDIQEESKKRLYFQFLWYGSLFLSMLVCIMVSLKEVEPLYLGSYELPWGGIIFGATLITYAGSAVYLKDELDHPWTYSVITFITGIIIGLFIDTFWPIAVSFVLANVLQLNWRRLRYLWYTCFILSSVLCILVSRKDTGLIALGSYELPWSTLLFGAVVFIFSIYFKSLEKENAHSWTFSVITFATGIMVGIYCGTFWPVAIIYVLTKTFVLYPKSHRYLWFSGLIFSSVLCVLVSREHTGLIAFDSYVLPGSTLLFGAICFIFGSFIKSLEIDARHTWIFSVITFATGILVGIYCDTFWPVVIFFVLANTFVLYRKPHRYLWFAGLIFSSVFCVLVSQKDTGLVVLGSYGLPMSTLLFGGVLFIFGSFIKYLIKEITRPWLFSLIAFAAGIPMGIFLKTFYPFAIIYFLAHFMILRFRRYDYSEVCYPLMALLILASYSYPDDASLLYGLLGWGLFYLMIPLFAISVFRNGRSNKRERIVLLATLGIGAAVMAIITPAISFAAAQISLLSLLIFAIWINYQAIKMLKIDAKESSSLLDQPEKTGRIKQNLLLLISASILGVYLIVYTFKGYLDFWDYMPIIDFAVIFGSLLAYPTIRHHASFSVIIPSTGVLVCLYIHYFDHSAETGIISIILIGTLSWLYVLFHRFIIKPVSFPRKIFQSEFTVSWIVFPIFLLIILCIDPFERVNPYLFWTLVLASGISAVIMRWDVLQRSFGLIILAILLMAAGFVSSFGNGVKILRISEIRTFFLPAAVTIISIAYIISMRLKSSTHRYIGKKDMNMSSFEAYLLYEEQKENATIILWLFFSLVISCFACSSLGDFLADSTGSLDTYWIFIFFSANWLLLLCAQYTLKSRNWYIILPLVAFWPLGLGIDGKGTTAAYLCISFVFVLLSQLFFYRRYMDSGIKKNNSKSSSAAYDEGFYSSLKGTMYTSTISIAAVGFGILTGINSLIDVSNGKVPNADFYIRYGFGILLFLMTFVFIMSAHRQLKRGFEQKKNPDKNEVARYLLEQKKISRHTVGAAFSILFFVVSLSMVLYRFELHSLAASAMVLTSVFLLFHIYKERERFWGFMAWGIVAALIIRLITMADPMEVKITPTIYLSGVVSDIVLSSVCLSIVYLIWTKDTVKVFSKLNRISPVLMTCLFLIFFITPGAKFGRYFIPLAILITAFKRRDSWSYPLAMVCFLLTFYLFTGNPPNPEEASAILTPFQRKVFLLVVMGVILTLVLGTHKRFGREPMTGQTAFGLSVGLFILAVITFWGWKGGEYIWLISVIWAALGLSLVFFGHTLKKSYLRWMGLSVIGFVILKIIFKDSSDLIMGFRVIVFLSVGIMVILVSFLYYKLVEKEKKELLDSNGSDRKT